MQLRQSPIGLLDSGVGGFTLLRELQRAFPDEDFVYVADTAHFPLGDKPEEDVRQSGLKLVDALVRQGCKLIVIACNTLSGLLLDEDPEGKTQVQHLRVPIVGVINYGCLSAALYVSHTFNIGLMATQRTIGQGMYEKALQRFDPTLQLTSVSCSKLIPLLEEGQLGSPATFQVVEEIVAPLRDAQVDTIILGCTHLPLVRDIIQEVAGASVTLIDPAKRTVAVIRKLLVDKDLLRQEPGRTGTVSFFSSGDPADFSPRLMMLDLPHPGDFTVRALPQ